MTTTTTTVDHWHTIENALNHFKEFISDLDAMSYWDGEGDGKQALERIDTALEFARERRRKEQAHEKSLAAD